MCRDIQNFFLPPSFGKMYAKFHQIDANCLHTLNSAKVTPLNVGISVTPSQKTHERKKQQQQEFVDYGGGGKMAKKRGFLKERDGVGKNDNFGVQLKTQRRVLHGKNGVFEKDKVSHEGFVGNPDGEILKKGSFGAKLKWGNGGYPAAEELPSPSEGNLDGGDKFLTRPNGKIQKSKESGVKLSSGSGKLDVAKNSQCKGSKTHNGKNGVLRERAKNPNGLVKNPYGRGENRGEYSGELRSGIVNGKVKTKYSTKWGRYGGCIPAILEALETISDLDEALKPWEQSLTNKERSIILKEQLGWERAMEIFEWFKRKGCYDLNVIHYNIMLRILGKGQQWGEVERLWREMEERRIKPLNSTYGTLIDVYSKGGLRGQAMKWLELMKERGMEPDEVTMGIVVQMYKKAGEFKQAEEFFKRWSFSQCRVEERGNGLSHSKGSVNDNSGAKVCLSAYTYNNLIDTYGKAGRVKEACETFDEMLKEGIVPTTVTFNTMIHMYGNNGQLGEVASLMQKMEELKCFPDTRTYNILISLHAKHNDIDMAASYFRKMKNASLEPDAVSYRTLLYAFSIRHMVGEAEELIEEMDERGLKFDEFTQSSLTRMYIEAGMLDKAWSWFQRFHLAGNMTSDCYSASIDAFGERGYLLEAEKVFNCCLKVRKLSVLEFNVMIKAYGICKRYDMACCLFDGMEKYGVVPDKCSFNSLIQMLASADLPWKAKSYVRKMQDAGLVVDCVLYCAVISSFAKLGLLDVAVGLYNEMIGLGICPDIVVYGVLINAFADTGNVKEATDYLTAMRDAGFSMNDVVCRSLIKLYTKVGYLKEAEEMYKLLQSFDAGPDIYSSNCMIDLYSERSLISQAEEIFKHLKRTGDANEFTYAMMLCMYKRNGRFVEAFWVARAMRERGLMTELLSYNNVLGYYASDGRFKEAAATFKEMLASAIQPDDSTFKSLGIILLKCGVSKDALQKLELMRKNDAESGVKAWTSTLCAVVGTDDEDDMSADDT